MSLLSHQRRAADDPAALAWPLVEALEPRRLLAVSVELVQDIAPGVASGYIGEGLAHQGVLYFSGGDRRGAELWRTNKDGDGATLLKNINPDAGSNPHDLTAVRDLIYFVANDGEHGTELWQTDGTKKGTDLRMDFLGRDPARGKALGIEDLIDSNPTALIAVGKWLLFVATDYPLPSSRGAVTENIMWLVNPTSLGNIIPTEGGEATPTPFAALNGDAFFIHSPGTNRASPNDDNFELWTLKLNNTGGQPHLVKDLAKGEGFSASPTNPVVAGDQLFFAAYAGKNKNAGRKLCVTDGTARGTKAVADVGLTGAATFDATTAVGNEVYFSLRTAGGALELWKSAGTGEETERIAAFPANSGAISNLTRVKKHVFFAASDGSSGTELWATHIETGKTSRVRDINPGAASSLPSNLTQAGKWLYFTATSDKTGAELWRTDGNKTRCVSDKLNPGATASSAPRELVNVDGTLYFGATTPERGFELYRVVTGKNPDEANVADASRVPARLPTASPFNPTPLFSIEDDGELNGSDPYLRPWPSRPSHELEIQHPSMSHGIQRDEMTPPGFR